MKKCPRFEQCSINLCPLDEFMCDRLALPEDELCHLRRITEKMPRTKNTKERFTGSMRGMAKLLKLVPKQNFKKTKTT
jgi:hypothetical protein